MGDFVGVDLLAYLPVLLLLGIAIVSGFATVASSQLFGPKRNQRMKTATYECGLLPSETSRRQVSVKFYLLAVLFILFDVETVYLIPWAVVYRDALKGPEAIFFLLAMLSFVGVLFLGLIYVLRKDVLNWNR